MKKQMITMFVDIIAYNTGRRRITTSSNQRQVAVVFKKRGCYARSFQLTSTETSEGFTSMVAAVSANQEEEEVWIDLESYREREHMNDVVAKINSDESALSLMKQYLGLLSPGSSPILAEFSRPPNV